MCKDKKQFAKKTGPQQLTAAFAEIEEVNKTLKAWNNSIHVYTGSKATTGGEAKAKGKASTHCEPEGQEAKASLKSKGPAKSKALTGGQPKSKEQIGKGEQEQAVDSETAMKK